MRTTTFRLTRLTLMLTLLLAPFATSVGAAPAERPAPREAIQVVNTGAAVDHHAAGDSDLDTTIRHSGIYTPTAVGIDGNLDGGGLPINGDGAAPVAPSAPTASAATFVVDTTTDVTDPTPGDGICGTGAASTCSLRAAVMEANAWGGNDDITIPTGVYVLTLGSSGEDGCAQGDLDVSSNIIFNGAGAATTIIDGNGNDRVFHVTAGGLTVEWNDLTITNGYLYGQPGGGIYNAGASTLTVGRSTVSDNQTPDSTCCGGQGGGIWNGAGGTVNVINSTLDDNLSRQGGGIYNGSPTASTLNVENSTFSDNTGTEGGSGGWGGGIWMQYGTVDVTNSTFSGNSAGSNGGAIGAFGDTLTVINSTFDGNSAGEMGGGIGVFNTTHLYNSIVANSTAGGDCGVWSSATSHDYNLDTDNTCNLTQANDLPNTNPLLGPLQDNGGDTWTHELLAGSPAIDHIPVGSCIVSADQRGFPRPAGSGCDIGAYEVSILLAKSVTPTTDVAYHDTVTYTVVLENPTTISDTNALVTDTLPSEVDFGTWIEQPSGAQVSSDVITWTGTLTANTTITFTFTATHTGDYCDVVENTAEYSGTVRLDGSDTFIVECPDLEIVKTVTPTIEVNPGGRVTYTLTFSNTGPVTATGVVITDSVPVSVTTPGEDSSLPCSLGANVNLRGSTTFAWDVTPELLPGERCTITITGDLSGTLAGQHTFANVATITTTDFAEYNTANNSASADVTVNTEPVADAGFDQHVSFGVVVTLDGSGSDTPVDHHLPLTYGWEQTGGLPIVTLSDPNAESPTFTAPGAPTVLTFTLTVTDALGLADSTPDQVVITVQNVPVAGLAAVNDSPTLLGDTTYFTATITQGSSVAWEWDFDDGDTGVGTIIGAYTNTTDHVYTTTLALARICGLTETTFTAVVTASNALPSEDVATTVVTISNTAPVADAAVLPPVALHQRAVVGSLVTLDGSGSYDPDSPHNNIVEYGWTQAGIVTVTLRIRD